MVRVLVLFVALNLALLGSATLVFRRAQAIASLRTKCRRCGYDVRATSERCPECGGDPLQVDAFVDSAVNLRILAVVLVIAAVVLDIPLSLLVLDRDTMSARILAVLVGGALTALLILILVLLMWHRTPIERSKDEVIAILRRAAEGRTDPGEWDFFVSVAIRDPDLDRIREICFSEFWEDYSFTKEDYELGWFSNPVACKRLVTLIANLEEFNSNEPAA